MAVSTYPGSVPLFQTHRNLLDDVDAEHINFIQREISAIASVLGINPHIYDNLEASAVSAEGARLRRVQYSNVATRLNEMERDSSRHCFRTDVNEISLSSSPTLSWATVDFVNPGSSRDPFSMVTGPGATLRKSGFWALNASLFIVLTGATDAENYGVYQGSINTNGQWTDGFVRTVHDASTGAVVLNMTKFGFFAGGTQVTLQASHNAAPTQRIVNASLSGFMVREGE